MVTTLLLPAGIVALLQFLTRHRSVHSPLLGWILVSHISWPSSRRCCCYCPSSQDHQNARNLFNSNSKKHYSHNAKKGKKSRKWENTVMTFNTKHFNHPEDWFLVNSGSARHALGESVSQFETHSESLLHTLKPAESALNSFGPCGVQVMCKRKYTHVHIQKHTYSKRILK